MDQHLDPAYQAAELRLQFFPVLAPAPVEAPVYTRLLETAVAHPADPAISGTFFVQCNCACK